MNTKFAPSPRNRPCEAISFAWEGTAGDYPAELPHYSATVHADPRCAAIDDTAHLRGAANMKPVRLTETSFAETFSQWLAEMDGFDGEVVIDPVACCPTCYAPKAAPARPAAPAAPKAEKPCTGPQLELLKTLFAEAIAAEVDGAAQLRQGLLAAYKQGGLTFKAASAGIDWLITEKKKAVAAKVPAPAGQVPSGNNPVVPEGRYALPTQEGHLAFYQVEAGAGKWAGYTFVVQLIGAPGAYNEQRLPRTRQRTVLEALAAPGAAQAAATAYGRAWRCCGRCHADLSNVQSRAAGYGQTCAGVQGFWYPTRKEALAILGEADEGQA